MTLRIVAAAAVVITLAALSSVNWAQDKSGDLKIQEWKLQEAKVAVEAQKAAVKEAARASALAVTAANDAQIRVRKFLPAAFAQTRHLTALQEVAERYSNSDDEQEKAQSLKKLRELTSQYFEEDMEIRQKELLDIQKRLEKLRAQLDRRRAKKDEIVDLQVKVAINEAEGLGFTSAPRENFKFDIRVPTPVMIPDDLGPPRVEVAVPSPPSPPADSPFGAGPVMLGMGAKGEAVRLLQTTLNESVEPSPNLNVDGDFGPETEKAVRQFQAKHNLEESGVVDDATRKKLDLPAELPPFIKN